LDPLSPWFLKISEGEKNVVRFTPARLAFLTGVLIFAVEQNGAGKCARLASKLSKTAASAAVGSDALNNPSVNADAALASPSVSVKMTDYDVSQHPVSMAGALSSSLRSYLSVRELL
jgi:hypothetical protein